MIKSYSFEVSVEAGGNPQIDGIFSDEASAVARAEYLLGLAKYTAVRVVRIDARGSPLTILEKTYHGSGKAVTIGKIEDAYFCSSFQDVYDFQSRTALLQLMRGYFDEQVVIPSELLHNYMMLRYLERDTLLFNQVGHRLASAQAARAGLKVEDRHDQLRQMFRDVLERAKNNAGMVCYAESLGAGLVYLRQRIRESLPPEDHARAITFAFSQYLSDHRDWPRKVKALCKLLEGDVSPPPETVTWVDEMLAETVDGNTPIRALVGYAPDLSTALQAMAATVHGMLDDRHAGTEALMDLSNAVTVHGLPCVRNAILNRLTLALDSKTPLTRDERGANVDAFKRLLPQLQEFGGFAGGRTMAAALTRRAKQVFARGGEDMPLDDAVTALLEYLPHPAARIGYLLDLLATDLGRRRASSLTQRIAHLFSGLRSVKDMAPREDQTWSLEAVREDFRRRLYAAGIPRHLADGLMRKLRAVDGDDTPEPAPALAHGAAMALPGHKPHHRHAHHEGTATLPEVRAPGPPPSATEIRRKRLELAYRGSLIQLSPTDPEFVIGRGEQCHLVVEGRTASRQHLVVFWKDGDFVAQDRSKNGSCVTWIEDRPATLLSRASATLVGSGTLWLGASPGDGGPEDPPAVRFKRVDIVPDG